MSQILFIFFLIFGEDAETMETDQMTSIVKIDSHRDLGIGY